MLRSLRYLTQMPCVAANWTGLPTTKSTLTACSRRQFCGKPKKLEESEVELEQHIGESLQQRTTTRTTKQKQHKYAKEGKEKKQRRENKNERQEQKESRSASFLPSVKNSFESITDKNKNTYLTMLEIFEERDHHRRNHVEFIYAALKNMKGFGVEYDLEVYKALINVMPKGKFIPTNMFQAEFMHYPKQQQCIIDLLEQMEDLGVMPDTETEQILLNIFGRKGHPLRKYWRMMYWMPKFKNLSPWPLPNPVPDDTLELAKIAVKRMCSVDLQSQVTVYETRVIKDAIEDTWVVSGMSVEQAHLLREHSHTETLYIDGPFLIWLRNRSINYFTLRAEPNAVLLKSFQTQLNEDNDDVTQLKVPLFGQSPTQHQAGKCRSVHEQNDGTILAICATGTSTKDSLLSWIRLLEANGNPALAGIPVLFRFKSQVGVKAAQIQDGNKQPDTNANQYR